MERKIQRTVVLKMSLEIFTSCSDNPSQLETQIITSVVYDRLNVFISDGETLAIIESNKPVNNRLVTGDDLFDSLGLAT